MSDQENSEQIASAMESARQPSKSILKDNTLPLMNDKRRVSFAPEVTLHKFDFVPSAKRRRTMGDVPRMEDVGASDENDGGVEILSDSSASDSFDTLERNADHIAMEMGSLGAPEPHDIATRVSDDEGEEATMELTSQFNAPNPRSEGNVVASVAEHVSNIGIVNQEKIDTEKEEAPALSSSDEDEKENINDEIAMELTEVSNVGSIPPPIFKTIPMEESVVEPSHNEDVTMELTGTLSQHIQPSQEEVTMEFTQVYSKTETQSTLPPVVEVEETGAASEDLDQLASPSALREKEGLNKDYSSEVRFLTLKSAGAKSDGNTQESIKKNSDTQDHETDQLTQEADESMEFTQVPTNSNPKFSLDVSGNTASSNNTRHSIIKSPDNRYPLLQDRNDFGKTKLDTKEDNDNDDSNVNSNGNFDDDVLKDMQITQNSISIENPSARDDIQKQAEFSKSEIAESIQSNPNDTFDNGGKEMVVTTTIPLTDNTLNVEDDSQGAEVYDNVSLNEFMNDIGIKFYDDLDIDANTLNRLSISFTRNETQFKEEDYARALPKLQLLELYEFSCEELDKNIQEGKKVFSEFNKNIETSNPQIFKEYYQADDHERLALNMKLQLIKDLTRHQSKNTWYDWRIQLSQNLYQELEERLSLLREEEESLKKISSGIQSTLEQIKIFHADLKQKLVNLLKINEQIMNLSDSDIQALKEELDVIRNNLDIARESVAAKVNEQQELESKLTQLSSVKTTMKKKFHELQEILASNRKYEIDEITTIESKFSVIQALSGLKYIGLKESVMNFKFDDVVDVTIDFTDIQDASNIKYVIDSETSKARIHNPNLFQLFVETLPDQLKGCKTVVEHFKTFRARWSVLRSIDLDLFKLSLKFPFKILSLSADELKFQLRYYNHSEKIKMLLEATLDMKQLLNYPKNVVLTAQVIRSPSPLSGQLALSYVLNDVVNNSLICSENLSEVIIA